MDWNSYAARISDLERVAIQAAPILEGPLPKEPFVHFPAALVEKRRWAHHSVPLTAAKLAGKLMALDAPNSCFVPCLVLASFELRHGFVTSWPGFALLFHKMFGDAVLPWLPSLFLAALGPEGIPRPQFDLEEVLNFHERHPVASLPKYG